MKDKRTESDWYFPPDMLAVVGCLLFPVISLSVALFFLSSFVAARHGNPTLLYISLAIATIGIVLLFFARLPLYRQKRFFMFGGRHLTGVHGKL